MTETTSLSTGNGLIGKLGPKLRAILAILTAALTLAVAVSSAAAADAGGWPTTCVELNDIVESHHDRPGNVGIYQRTYGDQAEAHCQADHRADVQGAFAWAFATMASAPSSETPADGWPTTCVGLNDIVESYRGNTANAGIYQRAHGDQAETHCRADHLADVQAAFAWARPAPASTPPPEPTPPPPPVAVPSAPRNLELRPVDPIDRSDDVEVHADPPAEGGGLPLQGYRWSLTGATYLLGTLASSGGGFSLSLYDLAVGEHTFTVNAFNAHGDGPSVSHSFTVVAPPPRDPILQAALSRLVKGQSIWAKRLKLPEVRATSIVFGSTPAEALAAYYWGIDTIRVSSQMRGERPESLAALLAHEVWHVLARFGNYYPNTRAGCFQNETDAEKERARAWASFGKPTPRTDLERYHYTVYRHWRDGTLKSGVRDWYQDSCHSRFAA